MKILNSIFTISVLALSFNARADVIVDIPANTTDPVMCNYSTLHAYAGDSVVLEAVFEPIAINCPAGQYLSKTTAQCETCPADHFCPGSGDDKFVFSENVELGVGVTECPSGTHAPQGATSAADCGKIIHIADSKLYLSETKRTSPALAIRVGDKTYYANMSEGSKPVSAGETTKLHVQFNGTDYTVHDITVE